MHLLLPPSEAKTTGGRGRPMRDRLDSAEHPLTAARRATVQALATLVDGDREQAARCLLLPPGVTDAALATNAAVLDSRTTPALRRYAGTVYEGLGFDLMAPAEQRLAARSVLVFSGLWGVVRGDEPVPDYRVPAKAELPGVGVASTYWRRHLVDVLSTTLRRGLVVDLRSGDYAAMWRPDRVTATRVVGVRVLSPAPRGGHAVISHTSKLAKGRLAAALVRRAAAGLPVVSVDDVTAAWTDCGGVDHAVSQGAGGTRLELYTG